MEKLTLENIQTWEYKNEADLSVLENLKNAHIELESFQNSCQEGLLHSTIKMGEIYKKAKKELGSDKKLATNQVVGDHFGKSEATIRNYIKIADNKAKILETPVSDLLSVRNMVAIIDGRATQNDDGTVDKKTNISSEKTKKEEKFTIQIRTLKKENIFLKNEIKELKKQLKEANKIKDKISTITGAK